MTVSVIVVVLVRLPDVPVIVTVPVPVVAVALAARVNVLDDVAGFGLNDAATPSGSPEAERFTESVKPFWGTIVMVPTPAVPCMTVRLPGEEERVKVGGTVTVRVIVVELTRLPEVPVMVGENDPVRAEEAAVRVSVLVDVAGLGLNDAVTPLGRPDAERVTPASNPFCGVIAIVLVPVAP